MRLLVTLTAVATALALLTTVQAGIALGHGGETVPWAGLLKARLVDWYACALFMPLLFSLARRHPVERASWPRTLPIHLLAAVPIAIAKEAIFVAIGNLFRPGVFELGTILAEDLSHEVIAVWALSALAHALVFQERAARAAPEPAPLRAPAGDTDRAEHFVVRTRTGRQVVPYSEIAFIDAQGNYARLVTSRGRFLVRDTMTNLAERLGPRFLRVHRRIIVRIAAIDRIEPRPRGGYWLHMASGERIGSGKTYAEAIRLLNRSSTSPMRGR
jgi:DNA-binding LytR/AlgR family response regulator